MPSRWSGLDTQKLSAAAMSVLLLASAARHFEDPGFFGPVVPDVLCRDDSGEHSNGPLAVLSRDEWVAVSGLLEAGAAVGLLIPATRRTAARCVAAMFTLFLTGHIDALRRAYGPDGIPGQRLAHTLRLPLQAPLIAWAWSLANPRPRKAARL
ncbi:MAG: hypothetical protein ABWX85_09790 [Arthrobacter sp.]